jgi:hypothetical protein
MFYAAERDRKAAHAFSPVAFAMADRAFPKMGAASG